MRKHILLAATMLAFHFCFAQTERAFPTKLSEWVEYPLPLAYGTLEQEHIKAGHDSTYLIYPQGDELMVKRIYSHEYRQFSGDSIPFDKRKLDCIRTFWGGGLGLCFVKKVSNGYIIAQDIGEFGGGLWWFSENGKEHYQLGESTEQILEIGGRILGAYSYSHGVSSEGAIFNIVQTKNGKWIKGKLAKLPGSIKSLAIAADSSIYIATRRELVRLDPGTMESITVLSSPFDWGWPSYSSLLIWGNDIFISGNSGILQIINIVDYARQLKIESGSHDAMWSMRWFKPQ